MPRMVVDSNYLQSPALRDYLSASADNYAVLTDYAAMEAYKGDPQVIFRSMEILTAHPKQVIVLKGTQEVCRLSAYETAHTENLIDVEQTRYFPEFCRRLAMAKEGDRQIQAQLKELRRDAADHMDRVLAGMSSLNIGFEKVETTYSIDELKILRRHEPITSRMADKFTLQVMHLAAELFRTHFKFAELPKWPEVRNTFIFRHAICVYALAVKTISVGAAGRAALHKLRNDLVDVNFATFATFFDGLLSADTKAQSIYEEGAFLLREVFAIPDAR